MTGLARLRKYLSIDDEEIAAHAERIREAKAAERKYAGLPEPEEVEPLDLYIPQTLFGRAIALGWADVLEHVDRAYAAGEEPQRALEWILACSHPPPCT